jgi:catechol 2,3-dioxygenase-like lactoylglutathione lyase family enzyme
MKINLTSVLVDDQAKALDFYTGMLGFVKKHDVPVGEHRWLTVVSPEDPFERLTGLGVRFTQEPAQMGPVTTAVLDDTCGNLIQIAAA